MILTNDDIFKKAPSVFTEKPSDSVSDKYLFIPTIEAIDSIRSQGFEVVDAQQVNSRNIEKRPYAKHLITFRHKDIIENPNLDEVPQLLLYNSHNGSASFKLNLGFFRFICSNGIVVGNSLAMESVRHIGYSEDKIINAQSKVLSLENETKLKIEAMKNTELILDQKMDLAKKAVELKFPEVINPDWSNLTQGNKMINFRDFLWRRRQADLSSDLWTVFNVIQENLIQGGIPYITLDQNDRRRRNTTRAVKSLDENRRINTALWNTATQFIA
jgi:hypothetical protein